MFSVWNLNVCLIFCEQIDASSASISLAQLTKVYIHIFLKICILFLTLYFFMWNSCFERGGGGHILQKHCTYYYCPVKSKCGCEKIGGVFCQPPHNVGVFSSSRQKKHRNLHLLVFSPSYILFNYTLETVLEQFPGVGCKLCGLSLSSQVAAFLYMDDCMVLS